MTGDEVADFNKAELWSDELERAVAIVRSLAAVPIPVHVHSWCMLCETRAEPHGPDCPYALAVEWTRQNPETT